MKGYTQAIRDAVLHKLQTSENQMSVRDIKANLGNGWEKLSYQQVANALYWLEREGLIPQRVVVGGFVYWWAEWPVPDDLEELWKMKPAKK